MELTISYSSKPPLAVEGTHKRARVLGETGSDQNQLGGQLYGTPSVRSKVVSANGNFSGIILPCNSLIDDRIEAMIRTSRQEGIDQSLTGSIGSAFEPVVLCIRRLN